MLTEGLGATILPIVLMILVIVAAYYTTRVVSMKAQRINKGKCLHIIDRIILGRDKQILLLEAGDMVFLLGISAQNMTSLGSLPKAQFEQFLSAEPQQDNLSAGFQGVFNRVGEFLQSRKSGTQSLEGWLRQRNANRTTINRKHGKQDEIDDMMQAIETRRERIRKNADAGDDAE